MMGIDVKQVYKSIHGIIGDVYSKARSEKTLDYKPIFFKRNLDFWFLVFQILARLKFELYITSKVNKIFYF